MSMEGYTAKEIADILGINLKAAKLRIFREGIKPITKDALYDKSVLEILKNTPGRGRPKKAEPEPEPVKPRAKAKKPAKPAK
jgi:transposase